MKPGRLTVRITADASQLYAELDRAEARIMRSPIMPLHRRLRWEVMRARPSLAQGASMTPRTGRRIHLTLMLLWVIPGIPISFWLRTSVPWLVFISVYAVIVGHWSGWSAERPSEIA